MEFLNEEMLKKLSAEEMEQLRREMRNFNHRLHEEIGRRKQKATLSRVEFERRRALNRIRTIKKKPGTGAPLSKNSDIDGAEELRASLRNWKIRQILNEYRTITGERLNKSMRNSRRYATTDQ